MTREEAVKIFNTVLSFGRCDCQKEEIEECLRMAIKALKQEPCKDCVSRQAVNTLVDELARAISDERCCMSRGRSTSTIMQDILDLQSVTPQQTRWIPVSERLPEESLNSVIGWDAFRERCVFVQFFHGHFQIVGKAESFDIKAWMPLPEAYKEESEE